MSEYEDFVQRQQNEQFEDVVDTAGEALVWMNTPAASKFGKKYKKFINKDIVLGNLRDRDIGILSAHFAYALKMDNQNILDARDFILQMMFFRFNSSNSKNGFARRLARSRFSEQVQSVEIKDKKR